MDKAEAIKRIKDHISVHHIGEYPHIKIAEALSMAITALATDNNVGDKLTPTDKDTNVLTNADRIRAMTDEELAEFISDVSKQCQDSYCGRCQRCKDPWCSSVDTEKWLQQPVED